MRTKANAVHYSYADPKQNRLYIGGPKEYAAYQKFISPAGDCRRTGNGIDGLGHVGSVVLVTPQIIPNRNR